MVFDICMISPLTKHSFLLSSRTVFYIDQKIRKWTILTNFLKTAFFTEQQHHTHFLFANSTQKKVLTIVQATTKCVKNKFSNCSINNKLPKKKTDNSSSHQKKAWNWMRSSWQQDYQHPSGRKGLYHVFYPNGIYRSIKHEPFLASARILGQLSHVASQDPISPLMRVLIKVSI